MHVAECGDGPLVLLCHGWPELWYSWRHQMRALAAAGFRAAAPDMRGFGRTTAPPDVAAYTIFHNVGDMVALVDALGEKHALIVGHDWGAPVAWHAAMMRPDVFPRRRRDERPAPPGAGRTRRSTPCARRASPTSTICIFRSRPPRTNSRATRRSRCGACSISALGETPRLEKMSLYVDRTQGFLGAAREVPLPPWLSEADVAVFTGEYERTGFRGGLNWYRNIDRNWELTRAVAWREDHAARAVHRGHQ